MKTLDYIKYRGLSILFIFGIRIQILRYLNLFLKISFFSVLFDFTFLNLFPEYPRPKEQSGETFKKN